MRSAAGEVQPLPLDVATVARRPWIGRAGSPLRSPRHRHLEGRVQEDREVPPIPQLRSVQEDAVEDEHAASRRHLHGEIDLLLGFHVVDRSPVPTVTTGPERSQQEPVEVAVAVRVEVEALGTRPPPPVPGGRRVVEAVDRSAHRRHPAGLHGRGELVGEEALADTVDAIDGDEATSGTQELLDPGHDLGEHHPALPHRTSSDPTGATVVPGPGSAIEPSDRLADGDASRTAQSCAE
jgi:hypothetical protein